MKVSMPVVVETEDGLYRIRPLFGPGPVERATDLDRALLRWASARRRELRDLERADRHDELAVRLISPHFQEHKVRVRVELRRSSLRLRLLVVSFHWEGRRIAMIPRLPDFWFTVERGSDLEERVAELLESRFRELEKDEEPLPVPPDWEDRSWVTEVEVGVRPTEDPPRAPKPIDLVSLFGGFDSFDGASELEKVGRCLEWEVGTVDSRVVGRSREAEALDRLLAAPDRRPVALLGSRLVGKTALLRDRAARRIEGARSRGRPRHLTWVIPPQRLIAGMSYLGQWQQRWMAVLGEIRRRGHVLVVDDVLGLFQAGRAAHSDLTMGHVLRPWLERRDLRFVAETTPEAFAVLQERDRGFADLFHVLRIEEPSEGEVFEILSEVRRRLQDRFRFEAIHVEALVEAVDHERRYGAGRAFPGKAVTLLERTAERVRSEGRNVLEGRDVRAEVEKGRGLDAEVFGPGPLVRSDLEERISSELLGQSRAVEALVDAILVAKSRLGDPARPLGSFLFLGPTGVGKTEAAKVLHRRLYRDADQLLRFDMNEYVGPDAVARLVGGWGRPDGTLTSELQNRPFCVLLLDEIEKAHPDVFDLLLQLLEDGRLTDAGGRTADATGAFIVLTSNLGADEIGRATGFGDEPASADAVYLRAAERFFRPELFNRIDRIVPFRRLAREDVRSLADVQLQQLLARDGLSRRKMTLEADPGVLEHLVDVGYDPELGARALRRTVDRLVARPVATRLSGLPPNEPTVVGLGLRDGEIDVRVHSLRTAAPIDTLEVELGRAEEVLARVEAALDRIELGLHGAAPQASYDPTEIDPERQRQLALRETVRQIRDDVSAWREGQVEDLTILRVSGERGARLERLRGCGGRRATSPSRRSGLPIRGSSSGSSPSRWRRRSCGERRSSWTSCCEPHWPTRWSPVPKTRRPSSSWRTLCGRRSVRGSAKRWAWKSRTSGRTSDRRWSPSWVLCPWL